MSRLKQLFYEKYLQELEGRQNYLSIQVELVTGTFL
jgi:hypothetical protein